MTRARKTQAKTLLGLAALATAVVTLPTSAGAADPPPGWGVNGRRVDLKVLVIDDDSSWVDAVIDQLRFEGVPYSAIPPTTPIKESLLRDNVSTGPRAKFQAIVLPSSWNLRLGPLGIDAEEQALLDQFSRDFGVRQFAASDYPGTYTGLEWPDGRNCIVLDGLTGTVTTAAKGAGFGYLNGPVLFQDASPMVDEASACLTTPLTPTATTSFTPFVTMPAPTGITGSLLGVYADNGKETLFSAFPYNTWQYQYRLLAPGIVRWLTRGISLSYDRNWFSVHIDDIFLPDSRWSTGANCTIGDNCPEGVTGSDIRMVPADVTYLVDWQNRNGMKLDLVFNGVGSEEAKAESGGQDPLTNSLLANRSRFRWVNHTWSHPWLGCVQVGKQVLYGEDFTCAVDADGNTVWVPQATISDEIKRNYDWARAKGISLTPTELVTGEHSGLMRPPTQLTDNPNLGPALSANGVRWIAADNSRDNVQRKVGSALTVPRHPMNIFYNTGTKAEAVDEYNWIYGRAEDGGSGICEDPDYVATTTCIDQLPVPDGFDSYIVPLEATIGLQHVLTNDPRPHYAHQSNLAEDRILYSVLDEIIGRYRVAYSSNTPIVNPSLTQAGVQMRRANAWAASSSRVEAYVLNNRITIVNRGRTSVTVPVSVPDGTRFTLFGGWLVGSLFGQSYAGERSDWRTLSRGQSLILALPA